MLFSHDKKKWLCELNFIYIYNKEIDIKKIFLIIIIILIK